MIVATRKKKWHTEHFGHFRKRKLHRKWPFEFTQIVTTVVPEICYFWNATASFRPVKSTPKSAYIYDKIAKIGQFIPKFSVLYDKKYTSRQWLWRLFSYDFYWLLNIEMNDTNYNISTSIFQSRRKPGRSSRHGLFSSQPVQPGTFQQIIIIFQQINHLLCFHQN